MGVVKKVLNNFEEILLVPILIVMSIIVVMQVFFRFVIKGSLPWSEELSRYLLVWVTFIGASAAVKRGAHVGVELVVMLFPKKAQKVLSVVSVLISTAFCLIVFFVSLTLIKNQIVNHQISPAMRIPMWWAYGSVPLGTLLMAVRFIQTLFVKDKAAFVEGKD